MYTIRDGNTGKNLVNQKIYVYVISAKKVDEQRKFTTRYVPTYKIRKLADDIW